MSGIGKAVWYLQWVALIASPIWWVAAPYITGGSGSSLGMVAAPPAFLLMVVAPIIGVANRQLRAAHAMPTGYSIITLIQWFWGFLWPFTLTGSNNKSVLGAMEIPESVVSVLFLVSISGFWVPLITGLVTLIVTIASAPAATASPVEAAVAAVATPVARRTAVRSVANGIGRAVWYLQWAALVVTPIWWPWGASITAQGWSELFMLIFAYLTLPLLLIGPIWGLVASRYRITHRMPTVYSLVVLAQWLIGALWPLTVSPQGDTFAGPSVFESLGMSESAVDSANLLCVSGYYVALTAGLVALIVAGRSHRAASTASLLSPVQES